ncbi:MAG: PEP/pyruvate-binding domain-containing protein, partial [Phycisphaeraceae bacterium]
YFRFGQHPPLIESASGVVRHDIDAVHGFESFTSSVYDHIARHGREAFCVFDCLSDLLSAWATDQMVGHFFQVTCPYLFRLDTIAYFALYRGHHAFQTIARIRETTQVMVGVYERSGRLHAHPIKVWQRHSPTMFLPNEIRGDTFVPLANSYDATTLLSDVRRRSVDSPRRQLDSWDRLFLDAEALAHAATEGGDDAESGAMIDRLCRLMISQDERILELARRYFTLADLVAIRSRMIGTGFIGGKAVGMLLARKILEVEGEGENKEKKQSNADMEPHDSFYVGSDVFYWFLVHNGLWDLLMRQKKAADYYTAGAELESRLRAGTIPDELLQGFRHMLEYFGQYPLIVRSSSLLEDGFSGAFAGKYESCFCVNQGSPEHRLSEFTDAVRTIFASTMSEDALRYRQQRGLEGREEPMGLLVQRVAGRYRRHLYMPDLAGVGVSYNTFVWSPDMDPRAGMLRIVMGLGTRAVDRVEGDYPCVVALDQPLRRPYAGYDDVRRFSQRDVDLLNTEANELQSVPVSDLIREGIDLPMNRLGTPDREVERRLRERGEPEDRRWLVTFEPLLKDGAFAKRMGAMLKTIERAYDYPVDVEFTLTFDEAGDPRMNLVQCRPLQTQGSQQRVTLPGDVPQQRMLFRTAGHFMGGSVALPIDRVIYVRPEAYRHATRPQRHALARRIGELNRLLDSPDAPRTLLIGPGRWGTSTPELGVPVRYAQIHNMAGLIELSTETAGVAPELSYGTHFFQDLVESQTFYAALAADRPGCMVHASYLERYPDRAGELLRDDEHATRGMLRVCDVPDGKLRLLADVISQEAVCCEEEGLLQ